MKKQFKSKMFGAIFLGAMALTNSLHAAEWDLPLTWGDGNFHVKNAHTFAKVVEQVTGGDVKINIHSGGSLGFKGPEMLTAIRDGLIPIGDILLSQQTGERKILGIEAQPFMVHSLDELAVLHKHFKAQLDKVAADYNQKILYIVPWPKQYVYTKITAKSVSDFKGIKIRTFNSATTDMFNRIGMTSVQLPWGEVVPSLAAGTINSVTTSASAGVDGKFWEFLKVMYPTSHVWGSNVVSVNLDAWKALSDKNRSAIESVAALLQPVFWEVSRAEDEAKVKVLKKNGIEVGDITPEMLAKMQQLTGSMTDEYIKDVGESARTIIEAFKQEVGR
ncbi:MAG: TRAP transporter substrate-binding protein [Rhizobiaceae bacterium]